MEKLAYCPHCQTWAEFTTIETMRQMELAGKIFKRPAPEARCVICGEMATYPPYQEEMARTFEDAFRLEEGIIPLEQIREIPTMYSIGKRPLSKLLGWGEVTFTRYFEGHVPSREYSDRLREIHDDPLAYFRMLKNGKDLITEVAYRKSEQAVEELVGKQMRDSDRICEVADYFVDLSDGDITMLMLQKLTYYSQGFSYVLLETPLFETLPIAQGNGPSYAVLTHEFKGRDLTERAESAQSRAQLFDEDERRLLDAVHQAFGCYSGSALTKLARLEEGEAAKNAESTHSAITKGQIKERFEAIVKAFSIDEPEEIARYARNRMQHALAGPATL